MAHFASAVRTTSASQHVTAREHERVGEPEAVLRAELSSAAADLAVDRQDPDREAVEEPVDGSNVRRSTPAGSTIVSE